MEIKKDRWGDRRSYEHYLRRHYEEVSGRERTSTKLDVIAKSGKNKTEKTLLAGKLGYYWWFLFVFENSCSKW